MMKVATVHGGGPRQWVWFHLWVWLHLSAWVHWWVWLYLWCRTSISTSDRARQMALGEERQLLGTDRELKLQGSLYGLSHDIFRH